MSAELIDEDSVDTEALQAQIDMSMSFAQSLVSSWMEPHKFPKSSRRRNLEQELTDYMKRPPRLGVGAAIPEGMQSQTREVARLKGKLTVKRPREEVEVGSSKAASDDEGESRVIAIKKKARFDPFDVVHGKKKKQNKNAETTNVKPDTPAPPRRDHLSESSDEVDSKLSGSDKMDVSPSKAKKKRSKASITTDVADAARQNTPPKVDASSEKPTSPRIPNAGKILLHEAAAEVASTKTSLRKTLPSDLLKIPLLNLTGPPSDPETDCEPTTPSTTTKKKRKRRKKTKPHPTADGSENTTPTNQPKFI